MCMKIWGNAKGREGQSNPHTTSDEHSRYPPTGHTPSSLFSPPR
jgi:hypothetical protein